MNHEPIPGLKITVDPSGLVMASADGGLFVAVQDVANLWTAIDEALRLLREARAAEGTVH